MQLTSKYIFQGYFDVVKINLSNECRCKTLSRTQNYTVKHLYFVDTSSDKFTRFFSCMNRLEIFYMYYPTERDASPLQGYPS